MADISRNGWNLHYETVGPAGGAPVVLLSGSGEQIGSVEFPDEQCAQLAEAGMQVVRLDNRDNGLSVPAEDPGPPDWKAIFATPAGASPPVPYTQGDMADDVVAVLDDLDVERAVVVGASMGADLARWMAVRHPDRVHGLMVVCS